MRLRILRLLSVVMLLAIIAALVYMQIIRGEFYYNQSSNNRIRVIPVDAPRGKIVDRQGTVLADNRDAYHVAIIDQETDDKDTLFDFLGKVLNRDPEGIKKLYAKRKVTPFAPVIVAEDVPSSSILKIEENRFQYPGLMVMKSYQRSYPLEAATAHAVGYVGKVNQDEISDDMYGYTPLSLIGKFGVEKYYDEQLRGVAGGRQIEVNSRGQEVRTLGIKEPESGKDVVLTIDATLAQEVAKLFNDRRGAAVVMDMTNGEVALLASSPSFNPNAFVDKAINNQVTGFFQNSHAPLLNRAVTGQFPPGSVFKVPVALAALQLNKIKAMQTYDCPGYYLLGGRKFGCAHVHGKQDLVQAIAHSCNVYFFHTGQILGPRIINAYAKAFGLLNRTGIDLPFESKGRMRKISSANSFFGGDILNLSIGQGDTISTPIQLTVLMAAVATEGIIIEPRVVKSVGGKLREPQDLLKRPRVKLRHEVWATVQEGLGEVVTDQEGTGRILQELSGVSIWGKTGTAQAGKEKENHAWFAGYVKNASHAYSFCVLLEHGGSSANAVELTKNVLALMQKLNLL